jgi:hypothetical protein
VGKGARLRAVPTINRDGSRYLPTVGTARNVGAKSELPVRRLCPPYKSVNIKRVVRPIRSPSTNSKRIPRREAVRGNHSAGITELHHCA